MPRSFRNRTPIVVREQATDRHGRPVAPGTRVRIVGEDGQPEGTVVRVLADYNVVTVLVEKGAKSERMYPSADVEAV